MIPSIKSSIFVVFFPGFAAGFLTLKVLSRKSAEIITKTESHEVSQQNSQVSTQATMEKDSTLALQTIVDYKSYSPNGKLKSETRSSTKSVQIAQVNQKTDQSVKTQTSDVKDLKTSTEITYQKNWMIGGSVPITDLANPSTFKFTDFKAMLAYRVIGDTYFFVASNYQLKTAEVGFLFPL